MNKIEKWLSEKGYNLNTLQNDKRVYETTNMTSAVNTIKEAIANNRLIYVLGDYDVDGIMSICILYTALTELNATFQLRFPKKLSEGYGLSEKIIPEIPDDSLLVTIDNGIAAVEIIEQLKERGVDTVILDHHIKRGDDLVPDAKVVVDPHVYRAEGEFEHYCGAGLGYKLTQKLGISQESQKVCNIFAAIATIQDIVPMVDDNRNIVKNGLRLLNSRELAHRKELKGIYALMDKLYLRTSQVLVSAVTEVDVSFYLGPCINAFGRMEDSGAQMAFERLMHYELYGMDGVMEIIQKNTERKEKTQRQQELLNQQADSQINTRTKCLVVYLPNLHEGVIGINAAHLTEKYSMPAIVLTDAEEPGKLKGSARSVEGANMKEMLDKSAEFIYAYGGHAGAAGLTVEKDKLKDFTKAINQAAPDKKAPKNTFQFDMEISESEVPELFRQLREYAPYGEGFPTPTFKVTGYRLVKKLNNAGQKVNHRLLKSNGISFNGTHVNGISFTVADKWKGAGHPEVMNVIATLGWSSYEKAVQLSISDLQAVFDFTTVSSSYEEDGYLI